MPRAPLDPPTHPHHHPTHPPSQTILADPAVKLHAPVVFLFNGGEETLSQASNGFMAHSPYAKNLGAFINLESTGPWGPDVVFQVGWVGGWVGERVGG